MPGLKVRLSAALRAARIAPPARRGASAAATAPLAVAGLFGTASGIGESARLSAAAFEAMGLDAARIDLSDAFNQRDLSQRHVGVLPAGNRGALVLHLNAPETAPGLFAAGMQRGRRWRVIGYWAWELEKSPPDWAYAERFLSEIWTPSNFSADAIRASAAIPVRIAPHAVRAPARIDGSAEFRARFPGTRFLAIAFADGASSLARKNPAGAVAAFRAAFPPERSECALVVKTRNAGVGPAAEALRAAAGGDPRIAFIDGAVDGAARWSMIAASDVVISLHRSEGFGLTLAEAMALGKPTIATGWSGNLDFMDASNAELVPFRMTDVRDEEGPYAGLEGRWADPDIAAAAASLKRLADDVDRRRRLGERAREDVAARLSAARHTAPLFDPPGQR